MELSSWLTNPVTKVFVEWLDFEVTRGREAVTDLIHEGKTEGARSLAGQVAGLRLVLASMVRAPAAPEETEIDNFSDPAEGKR